MDKNDNDVIKSLVNELVSSHGWKYIDAYIANTINTSKERLLTIAPTDAIKICEYQQTIKTLKGVLNFIKNPSNI